MLRILDYAETLILLLVINAIAVVIEVLVLFKPDHGTDMSDDG